MSSVRKLEEILQNPKCLPARDWQLRVIQSDECLSYVAWNESSREALVIDPKREDKDAYLALAKELNGFRWLGVIDTHTHADHISYAADLALTLQAPLIMHERAPSRRIDIRVSRDTTLSSAASPIQLILTPGHTHDSLTALWGPYVFSGDTILFGDVGRDDLPTGSPEAHFESLERLKARIQSGQILLAGHDHKGGRASDWATQLQINESLKQERQLFVAESGAFTTNPPKLFKESLFENFK